MLLKTVVLGQKKSHVSSKKCIWKSEFTRCYQMEVKNKEGFKNIKDQLLEC